MAIVSRLLRLWPLVLAVVIAVAGVKHAGAALVGEGGRRVALVVGNSDYRTVEPLKNASRDAREIARTLASLGFEVIHRSNLSRDGFEEALEEFYARSAGADAAVVFYSGHGFQLGGVNYLVPVDATLRDRSKIAEETLRLDIIARRSESADRQTLIFLDACRNDPLPENFRASAPEGASAGAEEGAGIGAGATSEGLSPLQTGSGSFIAFATQPGNITRDGAGDHSPFTSALLDHLPTPGISISDMMIRVRNQVEAATLKTQIPWDQSSLREQFYFNPLAKADDGGALTEEDREMLLALDPAMRRRFERRFGILIDGAETAVAGAPSDASSIRPQPRLETVAALDARAFDPARLDAGGAEPPQDVAATVATTLQILSGGPSDANMVLDDARTAVAAVPGVTVGPASVATPAPTAEDAEDGRSARPAAAPAAEAGDDEIAALASAERAVSAASPDVFGPVPENAGGSILGGRDGAEATIIGGTGADAGGNADAATGPRIAAIDPEESGVAGAMPKPSDGPPAEDAAGYAAPASVPAEGLPAAVQTELARLGCYRSTVDGDWGPGSERALLRYYATKRSDPDMLGPSAGLHARLKRESAMVCASSEPEPTTRVVRPPAPRAAARPVAAAPAARVAPVLQQAQAAPAPPPAARRLGRSMTLGAFR